MTTLTVPAADIHAGDPVRRIGGSGWQHVTYADRVQDTGGGVVYTTAEWPDMLQHLPAGRLIEVDAPIGCHRWWAAPHPAAELTESIEVFVSAHGAGAWIEVSWIYRNADHDEVHAFVADVAEHMRLRDLWLRDPQAAADESHMPVSGSLTGLGGREAAREDRQLHELIGGWVTAHEASRP